MFDVGTLLLNLLYTRCAERTEFAKGRGGCSGGYWPWAWDYESVECCTASSRTVPCTAVVRVGTDAEQVVCCCWPVCSLLQRVSGMEAVCCELACRDVSSTAHVWNCRGYKKTTVAIMLPIVAMMSSLSYAGMYRPEATYGSTMRNILANPKQPFGFP